jgi:succinyl-CoA synthetase beta subunit
VFLLEHHGKELLARRGIPAPPGVWIATPSALHRTALPEGPWMVKAQVASGGRGKAGAIRNAETVADIEGIMAALAGARVAGNPIHGFRVERRIDGAHEAYLSFTIDSASCRIRMLVADDGGVDVETRAPRAVLADPDDVAGAARAAATKAAPHLQSAIRDAATRLGALFLACDAELLEVNPLFVLPDGSWLAGDIKLVVDENAIPRQEEIAALLRAHPEMYPESARKLAHGFDYVELDPSGEIGLITTGAGLSMKLIDELLAEGRRPLNFCDIRTGQFRGDPARLIAVMRWIAARESVRVVLVNVFAGITDLSEFARLFVAAAKAVPELRAPVVARLIGRNLEEARRILAASDLDVAIEPDLDHALRLALAQLPGTARG